MGKIVVTKGNSIAKKSTPAKLNDEQAWRAREDLRCLQQAQMIQKDTSRLKAAKAEAQDQMKVLAQVTKK
jgi:hypothetical protein